MFTGLIKDLGEVVSVEDRKGLKRFRICTHLGVENMAIGASIACNGCCLTVVDKSGGGFVVDVSNETLEKTTLDSWQEGTKINLEPSLRLGDEMGGHIVSGHVDCTAIVTKMARDGESWRITIEVPEAVSPYISSKGSIALNGISLTVNEVSGNTFGVNIIPHTWQVTDISGWEEGMKINLEVDMLARYVARMTEREKELAA